MKLPFFYGWAIVAMATSVWILASGILSVSGVFLKPIEVEFGWTRGAISGAISLGVILTGVLTLLTGALTDRYGPRAVVLGGGLLVVLGLSLLSRVQTLGQFYLFWALVGIGEASFFAPTGATVSRWFTRRKGLALGITTAGAGMGSVILPPLATSIIARTDWRTALFLLGLLAGVAFTALALGLKRRPEDMGLHPYGVEEMAPLATAPKRDFSFSQALRTQALWRVVLASALCFSSYGIVIVHLIPYATDRDISPLAAAGLISTMGLISVVGRVSWGAVCDRLGSKRALSLCFVLAALPLFFLPLTSNYTALLFLASLFGLGYGGYTVNSYDLLGRMFGLASIGVILGAFETGASAGVAIGAVLGGYIFDLTGGYSWAFLSSALGLFLAVGLILTLKPPGRGKSE